MMRISVSEYEFLTTTNELRREILDMMREYAHNAGIDLHYEYRWAIMSEENFLLAKLKYPQLINHMTVRSIK